MIKNIFILVLILLNINSFRAFGQSNEDLILALYSNNLYESVPAINAIIDQNVNEALPDLSALYESKPYVLKQLFLKALFMFGDTNIHNRTIEFIENVDSTLNEKFPIDPLLAKVDATGILFSLQDYSTYNYIFELIDRDGISNIHPAAFHLLNQILQHIPVGETQAKNILLEMELK